VIIPGNVSLFLESSYSFSIFRVIGMSRMFFIFKLGDYSGTFQIMASAARKSSKEIIILLYVILLLVVFFSSAMFYAEQANSHLVDGHWIRNDGTISPFQNIPETFWWCIVTITTVGYGDVVPQTRWGKFVAVITMLAGMLVVALPVAVFAANFQELRYIYNQRTNQTHTYYLRGPNQKEQVEMVSTKQTQLRNLLLNLEQSHQNLQKQIEEIRAVLD